MIDRGSSDDLGTRLNAARFALDDLLVKLVDVLDGGARDPTWKESEAIERACADLGRLVRECRLATYRKEEHR